MSHATATRFLVFISYINYRSFFNRKSPIPIALGTRKSCAQSSTRVVKAQDRTFSHGRHHYHHRLHAKAVSKYLLPATPAACSGQTAMAGRARISIVTTFLASVVSVFLTRRYCPSGRSHVLRSYHRLERKGCTTPRLSNVALFENLETAGRGRGSLRWASERLGRSTTGNLRVWKTCCLRHS